MLNTILQAIGFTPAKVNQNQVIYKSPFNPTERTASFFVFPNSQTGEWTNWKDYASGTGGDHYKFVMDYFQIDFKSAKEKIGELTGGNHQELKQPVQTKTPISSFNQPKKNYEIKKVQQLQNKALLQYLNERYITGESGKKYLEEIYYQMGDKNYFGLAFKNNSGGYEVRNKYFKGSFGKKDITLIKNGSDTLKIFEGFMDFLSYIEIKDKNLPKSDYMVLNSLSLIDRAMELIKGKYEILESYLDNDRAGDEATHKLISIGAIDKREVYKSFKDLNEFWISRNEPHQVAEEEDHIIPLSDEELSRCSTLQREFALSGNLSEEERDELGGYIERYIQANKATFQPFELEHWKGYLTRLNQVATVS
jgi:hypothetical protein